MPDKSPCGDLVGVLGFLVSSVFKRAKLDYKGAKLDYQGYKLDYDDTERSLDRVFFGNEALGISLGWQSHFPEAEKSILDTALAS